MMNLLYPSSGRAKGTGFNAAVAARAATAAAPAADAPAADAPVAAIEDTAKEATDIEEIDILDDLFTDKVVDNAAVAAGAADPAFIQYLENDEDTAPAAAATAAAAAAIKVSTSFSSRSGDAAQPIAEDAAQPIAGAPISDDSGSDDSDSDDESDHGSDKGDNSDDALARAKENYILIVPALSWEAAKHGLRKTMKNDGCGLLNVPHSQVVSFAPFALSQRVFEEGSTTNTNKAILKKKMESFDKALGELDNVWKLQEYVRKVTAMVEMSDGTRKPMANIFQDYILAEQGHEYYTMIRSLVENTDGTVFQAFAQLRLGNMALFKIVLKASMKQKRTAPLSMLKVRGMLDLMHDHLDSQLDDSSPTPLSVGANEETNVRKFYEALESRLRAKIADTNKAIWVVSLLTRLQSQHAFRFLNARNLVMVSQNIDMDGTSLTWMLDNTLCYYSPEGFYKFGRGVEQSKKFAKELKKVITMDVANGAAYVSEVQTELKAQLQAYGILPNAESVIVEISKIKKTATTVISKEANTANKAVFALKAYTTIHWLFLMLSWIQEMDVLEKLRECWQAFTPPPEKVQNFQSYFTGILELEGLDSVVRKFAQLPDFGERLAEICAEVDGQHDHNMVDECAHLVQVGLGMNTMRGTTRHNEFSNLLIKFFNGTADIIIPDGDDKVPFIQPRQADTDPTLC